MAPQLNPDLWFGGLVKTSSTAIIVNDRGEAFCGWAWTCSIQVDGWEKWYKVPAFAIPKKITVTSETQFRPFEIEVGESYWINRPYLFSSREAAERTLHRIYGHGKLAVVT